MKKLLLLLPVCLGLAAVALAVARRPAARPARVLPDNPYHRFYTKARRLEELAPRPGQKAAKDR